MSTGTGADSLMGFVIDGPSDRYAVGHPGLYLDEVPTPAAPSASLGGAGNVTGSVTYKVAKRRRDGALTAASAASGAAVATADQVVVRWDIVVTNPTFTTDLTGWTGTNWAQAAGAALHTAGATAALTQNITVENGKTYLVTFVVAGRTAGTVTPGIGAVNGTAVSADGTVSQYITAAASGSVALNFTPSSTFDGSVDTIVVQEWTAETDATLLYRSENGGAYGLIHAVWGSASVSFTDDLAIGSESVDYDQTPPTINQTSENWGFAFSDFDSFDLSPEYSSIPSSGLSGKAGKTRGAPGPIKLDGSQKMALRAGFELPFIAAAVGEPTVQAVTGEPVNIATWAASTARRSPRTLTGLGYKGSEDVPPELLYGLAVTELEFAFEDGKMVSQTAKIMGLNHGVSGPAVKVSGTGTYAGTFVGMGPRFDAGAETDSVFIKFTQALSGNTFKFKCKVGDASTYDGAEITGYVNAVSHRMTKGGAHSCDAIELTDENDNRLGADVKSNRLPFLLLATHPLDGIAVDDIYEIPPSCGIPGSGSTPFTGVPARMVLTPRFTDAHVTLYNGGTVIDAMSGSLTISAPKRKVTGLGIMARTGRDIVHDGPFEIAVSIKRNYDSKEWERVAQVDSRLEVVVSIEGERIPITPSSLSTHREGLTWTMPQMAVTAVKSPPSGEGMIEESIDLEAEQPDNQELELFTAVLKTRSPWRIPA